jgi:hypothetical protein
LLTAILPNGPGFIDWVWKIHASVERHSHQIANTLVNIDGDKAVSAGYVTACLWARPDEDGKQLEVTRRGHYLERW